MSYSRDTSSGGLTKVTVLQEPRLTRRANNIDKNYFSNYIYQYFILDNSPLAHHNARQSVPSGIDLCEQYSR